MRPDETTTRRAIHGVGVSIRCDAEDVAALVDRRLAAFPVEHGSCDVELELTTASDLPTMRVPRAARVVHEAPAGSISYLDETDELWASYATVGTAYCSGRTRTARIAVARSRPGWEWVATRPLLTISLLELLKRAGLFGVHAAAVARGADAVVVIGSQGAGKSTTALTLALEGWSFLGDDLVFLREGEPGSVFAFPDEIDVTPKTLALLPALGPPARWPILPGYAKHQIPPATVAERIVDRAVARVVVAPRVAESGADSAEAMAPAETLRELVPSVLVTETVSSQAHLDLLARLALDVPAFRLTLASGVGRVSALLDALVTDARGRQ